MDKSRKLYTEACKYMPAGVNSPVRAFKAVGGSPLFIKRGQGSKIYDLDNKEYIDYLCSWGALILGHADQLVLEKVNTALKNGSSFGGPTELEVEFAKEISQAVPSIELLRLVNSGTEAVSSAVRLARGFTARNKIIKFEGGYHGAVDSLLVASGSGGATFGVPDSLGVPADLAKDTIVVPYNSINGLKKIASEHGQEIAAIIVEPVAGNMGVVLPKKGFLEGLRDICNEVKALLIFDEVITGFRLHYGAYQDKIKVKPDLTCLGKIIGGGFPLALYGGKREIMEKVSPLGKVYQAGTLSGNPVAVTAGLATLKALRQPGLYDLLEKKTVLLCERLNEIAKTLGMEIKINQAGSMFTVFFTKKDVTDYASAKNSDPKVFADYFWNMLEGGIYFPPSPFEANFVSTALTRADIDKTLEAAKKAFSRLNDQGQRRLF